MLLSLICLQIFTWYSNCALESYKQFLALTPQKFGLLTVTHARNGVYTYFRKHIETYASMQCPEISEISIVWNNNISPEEAGFSNNPNWKRPVYFMKTPFNSMDFRYILPKESQASVFFSMDDDVVVSCQQMVRSFNFWKTKAVGDIAPLMSYGPRGFDFGSTNQYFVYDDPKEKARFYSISLIGICWVPRFFLELYNTQKLWEIKAMRSIVQEKNNCDDIALNFLIDFLFPELLPIILVGPLQMKIQPGAQGLLRSHYPDRNECLNKFSEIIGYNPLKFCNREEKDISKLSSDENGKYILYLKRKYLKVKLLSQQSSLSNLLENLNELQQIMNQQKQEIKQSSNIKDNESSRIQQLKELIKSAKSDKQQMSNQLQYLIKSQSEANREFQKKQQNTKNQKVQKAQQKKQEAQSIKINQNVYLTFRNLQIISICGAFFVCLMLFLFCRICLKYHEIEDPVLGDHQKKQQKQKKVRQEIEQQSD